MQLQSCGFCQFLELLVGDARDIHAVQAEHEELLGLAVLIALIVLEDRMLALLLHLVIGWQIVLDGIVALVGADWILWMTLST